MRAFPAGMPVGKLLSRVAPVASLEVTEHGSSYLINAQLETRDRARRGTPGAGEGGGFVHVE